MANTEIPIIYLMPYTSAWHLPSNSVRPNTSALSVHLLQHFTFFKSLVTKPEMHWCTSHTHTLQKNLPWETLMATRLLPSLKYKENVHSTSEQTQEVLFQECLQNKTNPGQVCLHFLFTEDYGYEVMTASDWLVGGRASRGVRFVCLWEC